MDLDEQKQVTTVIEVEYNASKDGNLIPRVIFEFSKDWWSNNE